MSKVRTSSFVTRQNREFGLRCRVGDTSKQCSSLTSAMKVHHTWDPKKTVSDTDHGGVFNFGFSKNGNLLGVALERKSVLLFDAYNGKLVAKKTNAHTDCVNCVKFLDDRLFATCSDDTTVALWDTRYLKHNVQTFHGHSNWVKNIEYDSNQGLLLTSGFDGCIYTWNINKYSTEDNTSNRVFYTSGLMRSKLSPDFTKLVISTHEGYMIIVHNLDLSTLSEDLKGFKPNMYRLMQRSQTPLKIGLSFNHVFEQERNRVEFITDWPTGNEANIISSLQIHPQGWCILSRNTDSTENTEWTCVHDLQTNGEVKKMAPRPWEVERVTPHTSSAFCTSTNTPAFSSQAPSRGTQSSANDNQSNRSRNQSESNDSNSNQTSANENHTPRTVNQSGSESNHPHRTRTESISDSESRVSSSNRRINTHGPSETPNQGQNDITSSPAELNSQISSNTDSTSNPLSSNSPGNQVGSNSTRSSLLDNANSSNDEASPPANRHFPVPESSSMHNSLIQIRRGARQDDGSFSFSISVHTSSGRTMLFNENDLESDDDDHGIRIERLIPFPSTNREDNANQQNLEAANNNEVTNWAAATTQREGDTDTNRNISNESDDLQFDWGDESDIENESGHDLIEEEDYGHYDDSDQSDEEEVQGSNSINIEIPGSSHNAGQFNVSIERRQDIRDQEQNEHLFWNSGPPRIRRRLSNGANRNIGNSGSDTDNQSNSRNAISRSVQTVRDSNNTRPGNSLDSRPWSNSFMFVLESNSGSRRRRLLNLSYLDTYTETENKLLQKNIHSNKTRLLGYVKECNVGKGFIKEVAFSSDGRLISSPFGYGIRLFSFDSQCNELCDCVPSSPVELYEASCSLAHGNHVVATQFSPVHNMVVSGCLDGKIAFHQPVL